MVSSRNPQRTCLGCRETFSQESLLRFVCSPSGEVVPDPLHKLPGRGAYLCYRIDCVTAAAEKNQFQRSFRRPDATVAADLLLAKVRTQLRDQLQGLVTMLRKAGQLKVGAAQLLERLGKDDYSLIVLAEDISDGRASKVAAKAEACGVEHVRFATKDELGHWVGKSESSALGLSPGGLSKRFKQLFARYCQLSGEL